MPLKPQLSANCIDTHALKIVSSLQERNYTTYLVGGCVRDLMVGLVPKDYDIVTMAPPEMVQKIIRPSYIIGKRFRLVLAKRSGQQFEIATFRSLNYDNEDNPDLIDENNYGEPKEDALRRDFTVNGLFYDPVKEEVLDFTNGKVDIEKRILRMIGQPLQRIEEDPIRILRALRLSHRISFTIEHELWSSITNNIELLEGAILPRVREEILKILRLDDVESALWESFDMGILKVLTPTLHRHLEDPQWSTHFFQLLIQGLDSAYDKDDSYELYSIFMYSFLASTDESWESSLDEKFDDDISDFMRLELGMHRVETEVFGQAINLIRQLEKTPDPQDLRGKHRAHLLNNRALYLALSLAEAYHHLSHFEVSHWVKALFENRPQRAPKKSYRRRPKNK